jgi:hypothetical protein
MELTFPSPKWGESFMRERSYLGEETYMTGAFLERFNRGFTLSL